ncbi:uncharacterized protein sb:cb1058 [Salvelinus namaycush]|uniref:Uncharacterized protein sb:cb1058 n=1 Tax=Salvelinus namaycush TaxID=8040 RepID=A0A8U0Q9Y9_SALNM|nr:uncharacterized protein sb:cb1058 [Salvelinus namaycush]
MAIGKSPRNGSVRSPKYLDKSSGFYGRLDEPEMGGEEEERGREEDWGGSYPATELSKGGETDQGEPGVFDFNQGMMGDDDTTLLRRKPSRLSSRWRRSSRKAKPQAISPRQGDQILGTEMEAPVLEVTAVEVRRNRWGRSTGKKQGAEPQTVSPREEGPILGMEMETQTPVLEVEVKVETEEGQREKERRTEEERTLVHFASREEADDQVLIKDKKRGREEEKEEEMKGQEEMKVMRKRSALKNYRKTFDRAFRRGWEIFVTNLYSVTLTPDSSPPPPSREMHHSSALAEYR